MARIKASEKVKSIDFNLDEIKHAVRELKTGRCMDPQGLFERFSKLLVMSSFFLFQKW